MIGCDKGLYDAIVLGPVIIKYSLLIIIVSFTIAFFLFRLISPFDNQTIKNHLDVIVDLLIFTFFSILGAKIILNIQLLMSEPIAVLSYPSDANALYLASFVVVGRIYWIVKKQRVNWRPFFDSLTRFLLLSHFFSLFGMMLFSNQSAILYQLALHFIGSVLLIWFGEKAKDDRFMTLLVVAIGLTSASLGLFYPIVFFGYYVHPSYYLLIALFSAYQFYQMRRGEAVV